jgi:hypothetical protein
MNETLECAVAQLSCFPAALNALLRDLPEALTLRSEGETTWTAFEIVGHLIHTERSDWMPRARMILRFGETRTFDTVNRTAHLEENKGKALPELLDEFARLRAESMAELRSLNLQPEELERRGRHPALGTVTLSQLLATWAAHDLTHLHQLSRVLGYQYRDAVGPWSKFLGVLHCSAHGS